MLLGTITSAATSREEETREIDETTVDTQQNTGTIEGGEEQMFHLRMKLFVSSLISQDLHEDEMHSNRREHLQRAANRRREEEREIRVRC